MENINLQFPCREKQISLIHQLIGQQSNFLPPSIFIYGQPAVGKTTILLEYLKINKLKYAYINCIECYTNRLLFESILSQLNVNMFNEKCDNFINFIYLLKMYHELEPRPPYVIILDGIEKMYELNSSNLLAAFGKLQELTSILSLTVIFISKILPEKFNIETSYIPIYFPQYNRDDFYKIFKSNNPECITFDNYLRAALTVFLRTTRDFTEMTNLVISNYEVYCEPINKGDLSCEDTAGLWRSIAPQIKFSLNSVYLGLACRTEEVIEEKNHLISHRPLCAFDLPYYAKYFLIAAYLASYNSTKHDKRLFLKNHGKKKKRNVKKKIKENVTNDLLGPKAFSLDRLLAIFYAISEEKASLTVNLLSQIATLVELRLLVRIGDSNIEKPKYKCLVGLEYVENVAKTLGFNLKKYLTE